MLRSDPRHPRTKCCRPPCCYVSPEAPTLSRPTKADEGDVSSGAAFPPSVPRRVYPAELDPMLRADVAVRRFWSSAADQALVRQQLSTKSPMLAACVSVRPTSSQGELHHNQIDIIQSTPGANCRSAAQQPPWPAPWGTTSRPSTAVAPCRELGTQVQTVVLLYVEY